MNFTRKRRNCIRFECDSFTHRVEKRLKEEDQQCSDVCTRSLIDGSNDGLV